VPQMQNKISTNKEKKRLRKKLWFLLLPSFFVILSVFGTQVVYAGPVGDVAAWAFDNTVMAAFKYLLYWILVLVSWFTSVAVTIFAYAVDPQNMSGPTGLLNLQATYDMWKFVRDFINIFFILGLLFIAFAFVFQIESYSNSKAIIKLIIAALLVNFSFPIARIIIDLANVPMYFFLQMIMGNGDNASVALSSALGASSLINVIVPNSVASTSVATLLAGIIFLFIFTITILVLAMQLLIRLIALVLLVILSPIGFVASGIPGMKKYGSSWWDNFLKYTFFGPAAIFMLVIATNFFAAVADGNQFEGMRNAASATDSSPGFIASMALFFIPIVMLWFTMGLSSKFSVAGASVATDYGKKFANWTKKKTYNNRYGRGIKKGAIERMEGNRVLKNLTPKYSKQNRESGEALTAGLIGGGFAGRKKAGDKPKLQRINEKVKENKEKGVNDSTLIGQLKADKNDEITRKAAALSLAENGSIKTAETLKASLEALKTTTESKNGEKTTTYDQDMLRKVLDKSKDGAFNGLDEATYRDLADANDAKGVDGALNDNIETLNDKVKKAGKVSILVEYDAKNLEKEGKTSGEAFEQAFRDRVGKMNNADLIKQKSLTEMAGFEKAASSTFGGNTQRMNKIIEKAYEDGSADVQNKWEQVRKQMPSAPESPTSEAATQEQSRVRSRVSERRARQAASRNNKARPS
jgi:hypothetical protein